MPALECVAHISIVRKILAVCDKKKLELITRIYHQIPNGQ